MNQISAIIIDDERPACERLKKLLASFPQIQVISSFTNSREALDYIVRHKPDLLFLDVELEQAVSAFDFLEHLRENFCHPYVVIVTAHPHYAIKAIKQKVFDYLMKPVDIDELKETIDRLMDHQVLKNQRMIRDFTVLSEREKDVLKHVLEGRNSREIANLLFISINTVHTHRRNILKKSGATSIIDLLRMNYSAND